MKRLIPFLLALNIIWSRPDGGVSITSGYTGNSRAEAAKMLAMNYVPRDWEAVAFDVDISFGREKRNQWRWDKGSNSMKDDLPIPAVGNMAGEARNGNL